jgi:glucosamine-6-phosphate deaminase
MKIPKRTEAEQLERIRTSIYPKAADACTDLAREISDLIRARVQEGKPAVLGLATGSTPVPLYRELIRLHREEGLSFANVHTFNLDEYFGLPREHAQSYHRFMQQQFFAHIDIPADHIHIPDGMVERSAAYGHCQEYEEQIRESGGIDLQILGIGRTGHIGFNEPGSSKDSRTRLVTLDSLTRHDAARDFLGEVNVPRYAVTMGVGTILEARRVRLLAWGDAKASIVARAVEGVPVESVPASFLQDHADAQFVIDGAAAAELTRIKRPWKVGEVKWSESVTHKAVLWLAETVKKPILKLTDEEYSEHGMAGLLTSQGPAYDLNIRIFNQLQHTITGWPGGKPDADDSFRPERARPFPKQVLVLSPEPQDDVLYMGGTLSRLVKQGHRVTVAYVASGNLAVPDSEVLRSVELMLEMAGELAADGGGADAQFAGSVREQLAAKKTFDNDTPDVRRLKRLVRRSESRSACRICGLPGDNIRFLDLPFYENGHYRQFSPRANDRERIAALLKEVRPDQIFITGNLAEPSSVQGICFDLFRQAFESLAGEAWTRECRVWLYRGSGSEWDVNEIEMAVPLSPDELANKIQGIYQHQSQRSQHPIRTSGHRESWQQAEAINRTTAESYNRLGLAEYEAIEAFRRWSLK